jgi:hypothetical protein
MDWAMSVPKSGGFGSMFFGEHYAHLVVDISHRHQKRELRSIEYVGGALCPDESCFDIEVAA